MREYADVVNTNAFHSLYTTLLKMAMLGSSSGLEEEVSLNTQDEDVAYRICEAFSRIMGIGPEVVIDQEGNYSAIIRF